MKAVILFIFSLPFVVGSSLMSQNTSKIEFWSIQKRGANIFNALISREDIKAAKNYGIAFIRLAPDKFSTSCRDFLLGTADGYTGLVKEDLQKLKEILDMCFQEDVPVVLSMLSLPGSRWKQNNDDKDDLRIWQSELFQRQAAQFWQDLATELKDHPAIVGYNILNEPHPERMYGAKGMHIHELYQEEVQLLLHDVYASIIKSIRSVDTDTPLILDSSAYGDPHTFGLLQPHDDEKSIYSFHMYEPYEYTNHQLNGGTLCYPGVIGEKEWNKHELKKYMDAVTRFQQLHHIPANRILVGEFGCHRMSPGIEYYFEDLIDIFTQEEWHFAFYAFREDTWEGMDYELGNKKLPWNYWDSIEKGNSSSLERSNAHPVFAVLENALIATKQK